MVTRSPDWLGLRLSTALLCSSFLGKEAKEMDIGWWGGEAAAGPSEGGGQIAHSEKGTGFTWTRWKDCLFPLESSIKMTNLDTL